MGQDDPQDFMSALQSRQNSLVGLGLGLMSHPGYASALQGYESGARTDSADNYRRAQALQHQKELAFRQQEAGRAQSNADRQFGLQSQLPEERQAGALGYQRGSPEYQKFLESKIGPEGNWKLGNDDRSGEKFWYNERTLERRPMTSTPGQGSAGVQWPSPETAPGPTTPQFMEQPRPAPLPGAVGYGAAGMGPQGFGTGMANAAPGGPALGPGAVSSPRSELAAPPGTPYPAAYEKGASEAAGKRAVAEPQRLENAKRTMDTLNDATGRALNILEKNPNMTTGRVGQAWAYASPTGDAGVLKDQLDAITSNLAIDKLMEMKRASSTGASGFGQLNIKELETIQTSMGVIKQTSNPDEIKYNLKRIRAALNGDPPPGSEEFPPSKRPASASRTGGGELRPGFQKGGYVFKGGDPSKQESWALVR